MNDIFEKTVINITARVQKQQDGTYQHEIVVGFLPMDDVVRYDSKKFYEAKDCAMDMFINLHKNIKKLICDYEP